MSNHGGKKKGVVLLIVLGTLLVVVILANVVLNIILSQSRLTHHQVSRIQAYYAAQAGMNLAIEKLRTGAWQYNNSYCINCSSGVAEIVSDNAIPYVVMIVVGNQGDDPDGPGGPALAFPQSAPILITTTYTCTNCPQ